jgi:hypothetical protein
MTEFRVFQRHKLLSLNPSIKLQKFVSLIHHPFWNLFHEGDGKAVLFKSPFITEIPPA